MIYFSREIYIGRDEEMFQIGFLNHFSRLNEAGYYMQGYVLDLSKNRALIRRSSDLVSPPNVSKNIIVGSAANLSDELALQSLQSLLMDCDPGTKPNRCIINLPFSEFPKTCTATRLYASKWFFGKGSDSDVPKGTFEEEFRSKFQGGMQPLDEFLRAVGHWHSPQRSTALAVAPQEILEKFLFVTMGMAGASFSLVQLAFAWDEFKSPEIFEEMPHFVFTSFHDFLTVGYYFITRGDHSLSSSIWLVELENEGEISRLTKVVSSIKPQPALFAWIRHAPNLVFQVRG